MLLGAAMVFLGVIRPASAAVQEDWQAYPNQTDKNYFWVYTKNNLPNVNLFGTGTDSNGHPYFSIGGYTILNQFYLMNASSTPQSLPHYEDGWNFWYFANKTAGTDSAFYYEDGLGSYHHSDVSLSAGYSVAGDTIYTFKFNGVSNAYTSPETWFEIVPPRVSNKIYAFVYTDADLSYIDTEAELYAYLNNLLPHDDIIFSAPLGSQVGSAPQNPFFYANYSISTTTSWNAFRLKVNQFPFSTSTAPLATFYSDTYLDHGNYQTGTSSIPIQTLIGTLQAGKYSYTAEFLSKEHSTGQTLQEGGYNFSTFWFWLGLTSGNPYIYPLASTTASSTPMDLCVGLERPASIFNVVEGVQWALCNVANWLFVPSGVSVQNYQDLTITFQEKAPFAYFFAVKNSLNSLSATGTPAYVLSSTTGAIGTTIFTPLKTGLTWLLWLIFGIFCIKRIAKFDF